MAVYLAPSEKEVRCPFNDSHAILESKFSSHLVKCQLDYEKNNPGMAICSYNWNHRVNKEELLLHLINCPDRGNIIPHIAQHQDKEFQAKLQDQKTRSDEAFKGICWDNPDEDWGKDSNHATFIVPSEREPSLAPAAVPVLKTRSEKKAIRFQNLQRSYDKMRKN